MSQTADLSMPVALEPFYALSDAELSQRVVEAKQQLGSRCLILGHHYQREEVYHFADLTGDSLKLARLASQRPDADYIVFCGVHFMAEVADILSAAHQTVILPDMAAGCSMADMADFTTVYQAWQEIAAVLDMDKQVTPITYVNSTAELKAFCGRHGGIVCTSSNAIKVLEWALARREKVFFFPDQHLGRNSAVRMGIGLDEIVVYRLDLPHGGLTPEQIRQARVILWDGFCSVHMMFKPQHIDYFRANYPGIQIIVHPECTYEVCRRADSLGSTEYIQQQVRAAPDGTKWAVGTELNLVTRLQHEMPNKEIFFLSPVICMCSTMFRIDLQHLCWTLENLLAGHVVNPIRVPESHAKEAIMALDRMLAIV